jgi:hypothetical protein
MSLCVRQKELRTRKDVPFGLPGLKSRKYQNRYYTNKLTRRMTGWLEFYSKKDLIII